MKKLCVAALVVLLALGVSARAEIPTLEVSDLTGSAVNLQSYIGVKPLILAFAASWSKSCQEEIRSLQEIYEENRSSVEVLAVFFDKKPRDLAAFMAKNEITFPVLLDKKLTALDRFQILILPTTFCVNRQGTIEKVFVDYDENVKKAIEAWLKS